jgi:hypothetical protein
MELSSTPARATLAAFGGKRIELMAVAINKETIEFDALCYNAGRDDGSSSNGIAMKHPIEMQRTAQSTGYA